MTEAAGRARARGVRRQPRVHEQPVRDQPAPRRRADRRRPRLPPEVRRQGHRRPARAASRPSWASRSTTRAARARTCTSRSTATARNAFDAPDEPDGVSAELRAFIGRRARPRAGADGVPRTRRSTPTGASSRTRWRRRTRTGAGTTARRSSASRPSAAARPGSRSASATAPPTRTWRSPPLLRGRRARDPRGARPRRRRSTGDAYRAEPDVIGAALPQSLDDALDALEADDVLRGALGPEIVEHVPGDEALRDRAPPRVGLGLGDRRVPPPPLGRAMTMTTTHFIDLSDHDAFVEAVPHEALRRAAPRGPRALEPRARRRRGLLGGHPLRGHPPRPPQRRRLLLRDRRHLAGGPRRGPDQGAQVDDRHGPAAPRPAARADRAGASRRAPCTSGRSRSARSPARCSTARCRSGEFDFVPRSPRRSRCRCSPRSSASRRTSAG